MVVFLLAVSMVFAVGAQNVSSSSFEASEASRTSIVTDSGRDVVWESSFAEGTSNSSDPGIYEVTYRGDEVMFRGVARTGRCERLTHSVERKGQNFVLDVDTEKVSLKCPGTSFREYSFSLESGQEFELEVNHGNRLIDSLSMAAPQNSTDASARARERSTGVGPHNSQAQNTDNSTSKPVGESRFGRNRSESIDALSPDRSRETPLDIVAGWINRYIL